MDMARLYPATAAAVADPQVTKKATASKVIKCVTIR